MPTPAPRRSTSTTTPRRPCTTRSSPPSPPRPCTIPAKIGSTSSYWTWKGRIKKFPPELERNNTPVMASVEIRNTGAPVIS